MLKYWVSKEAFLKLNGTGFLADPRRAHVSECFDRAVGRDPGIVASVASLEWIDVGAEGACACASPGTVRPTVMRIALRQARR